MKHTVDINIYNEITQQQKLYQFLSGINEIYDKDRRDILHKIPVPTVKEAYASIRREISRREIMTGKQSSGYEPSGIGNGLITKQKNEKQPSLKYNNSSGVGGGFITIFRSHREPAKRETEDKTHLHCTYRLLYHNHHPCLKILLR